MQLIRSDSSRFFLMGHCWCISSTGSIFPSLISWSGILRLTLRAQVGLVCNYLSELEKLNYHLPLDIGLSEVQCQFFTSSLDPEIFRPIVWLEVPNNAQESMLAIYNIQFTINSLIRDSANNLFLKTSIDSCKWRLLLSHWVQQQYNICSILDHKPMDRQQLWCVSDFSPLVMLSQPPHRSTNWGECMCVMT